MTDADLDFYPFGSPDSVVTAAALAICAKRGEGDPAPAPQRWRLTESARPPRAPRLVRFGAEPPATRDACVAHESNKRGW